MTFPLARMSTSIVAITGFMLALPLVLLAMGLTREPLLTGPALLMAAAYTWVWLRFRPAMFVVHAHAIEVRWPLKRREISRSSITNVSLVDRGGLRREIGWGVRVGAGGLWGAFGWLWTTRRGIVQMYISRTDGFVWIERGRERPWLITPEDPEAFVGECRVDR
jgi:Bacterial PH domain